MLFHNIELKTVLTEMDFVFTKLKNIQTKANKKKKQASIVF